MENSKFDGYINLIFTLALPNAAAESLCDKLLDFGAVSASIEDADAGTAAEVPQFGEPGMQKPDEPLNLWKNSKISSLWFAENFDLQQTQNDILEYLQNTQNSKKNIEFLVENVAEQNWVKLTQSQFEPIDISQNLQIIPTWHYQKQQKQQNQQNTKIQIILDPGMAFGTGSHPTTHLCLNFLEYLQNFHEKSPKIFENYNVLDYGCGSGILGIAAAKLGAKNVVGVDIDNNAVKAAKFNAEQNSVAQKMRVFSVDEFSQNNIFDVVVANILANPLRLLAPMLANLVKNDGGFLALSGILTSQSEEIIQIYSPYIELKVFAEKNGWVCLYGAK